MPEQILEGNDLKLDSEIDKLREQIHNQKFNDYNKIRQFINKYVEKNPEDARNKSDSLVTELIGNIHSELGIEFNTKFPATEVISNHVKSLILGRAQTSEDTSHWAVHHAANQVTMYSGQFVYTAEDIFIDGAGMDFIFRRIYKSQGFNNGPLGVNWDHNYNLWLRKINENKIVRLTGNFQESEYQKNENTNYWFPQPGEHSIIFEIEDVNAIINEYNVEFPSDQEYHYGLRFPNGIVNYYKQDDSNLGDPMHYYLKYIVDRFGNYLTFNYEDSDFGYRLKEVLINNPKRKISFDYDNEGRIIQIKDYLNRTWSYIYDDYGDLTSFTTPGTDRYPEGLTERYVYSTPYYTGELQHKMVQVIDTAGRLYLENEYGTDKGLLNFCRVVRQKEGNGERYFEYEDISLATGLPSGQPEIEEDMPAYQTVMTCRNGHPVHYIYNKFGNLIAREEDTWGSGLRRRLVTHYRYNRDGALIGEISPEGRITQYYYGRDEFMNSPGIDELSDNELYNQYNIQWNDRLSFGNRLAIIHRYNSLKNPFSSFQFPNPVAKLNPNSTNPEDIIDKEDIIIKFSFDNIFQNISSISNPIYTDSPFISTGKPDPNPNYKNKLISFKYDIKTKKFLEKIHYPDCTRNGIKEIDKIEENFLKYDKKGRLKEYQDLAGTIIKSEYYSSTDDLKEGYLKSKIIDINGLNLKTNYMVNDVGIETGIIFPKGTKIEFEVNDLNQIESVKRTLISKNCPKCSYINPEGIEFCLKCKEDIKGISKFEVDYKTNYKYCRNMRNEQVERDIKDNEGKPLWGGTEVHFLHYDENDNISKEQIGSLSFKDHLITKHAYDDGDLRTRTISPKGNAVAIKYDEIRQPVTIIRGLGSPEETKVHLGYDGDGLVAYQRDGRGLKTAFSYDSFGRLTETRNYDLVNGQDILYRIIRQDYDKAGNLTVERLFIPDGKNFKLLYHASYEYNELNHRIEERIRIFKEPLEYKKTDFDRKDDFVDNEAIRTLFFYDKAGRITRVERHGKRLDENGNYETVDTILSSSYNYNAVGWLEKETDPLGNFVEMHYDKHGLVKRVDSHEKWKGSATGEEIFSTFYDYDSLDRLLAITDSLGNVKKFDYDSRDAILTETDPLENIRRYEYDIYGRKTAERIEMTDTGLGGGPRQLDSDIVTQFVYDANGNLIRLIDAHGTPTDQAYDALDRRIELKYVDGSATTYKYDGNNNIVWMQDNNGLIKHTTYNSLNNPVLVEIDKKELKSNLNVEGATQEEFRYDALGRITKALAVDFVDKWQCDIHFKVDSIGQVYEESTQFSGVTQNFILKRQYDDFGFLGRLIYPNGRIIYYKPDALNRIESIFNQKYGTDYPGNNNLPKQRKILENEYRGLRIGGKKYGNGTRTSYSYDGNGRVIEIKHIDAQNNDSLIIQHLYDAAGNMRFKYEFMPDQANYSEIYRYDSIYQLTYYKEDAFSNLLNMGLFAPSQFLKTYKSQLNGQIQINHHLGNLSQLQDSLTYKYDKLGNRLEKWTSEKTQPNIYIPNNLNQYSKCDNTVYRYDLNGNLKEEINSRAKRDYIYNHRNQLNCIKENHVEIYKFRHDALGRRILSVDGSNETFLLYDKENIIEEYNRLDLKEPPKLISQNATENEIGTHYQIVKNNLEFWYQKDLIGSTRIIADNNAKMNTRHYRYTPFGQLKNISHKNGTKYLFVGHSYDKEIDSYDFRARNYISEMGRFMQRDPKFFGIFFTNEYIHSQGVELNVNNFVKPSKFNPYIYSQNNPLKFVDPDGQDEVNPNNIQKEAQEQLQAQIQQAFDQGEYETVVRGEKPKNYIISGNVGEADVFESVNYTSKYFLARSGLSLINNVLNLGGWLGNTAVNLAYDAGRGINWIEKSTGINLNEVSTAANATGCYHGAMAGGLINIIGRWSSWANKIYTAYRLHKIGIKNIPSFLNAPIKASKQLQHTLASVQHPERIDRLVKEIIKGLPSGQPPASLLSAKYSNSAIHSVVKQLAIAELRAGKGQPLQKGGFKVLLDMKEKTGWVNEKPVEKLMVVFSQGGQWHYYPNP